MYRQTIELEIISINIPIVYYEQLIPTHFALERRYLHLLHIRQAVWYTVRFTEHFCAGGGQ